MSAPTGIDERTVEINGQACRVWEKGSGPRVGYLSPAPGVPRWQPFLNDRRFVDEILNNITNNILFMCYHFF